ncbi:MAG: hypothetical protein DRH12_11985 [Deltaproteobacteria bacterium]|nr:MAG: hypothetical protein DRH12_11985 [Deltaproteobacteria bacterium]
MGIFFSTKDIKELLSKDTGFATFLNSLPSEQKQQVELLLTDQAYLDTAFSLLPDELKDKVCTIFADLLQVPQQAMGLYKECRFKEARALLHKTIELYSSWNNTGLPALNNALGFVIPRALSLIHAILGDVEWSLGKVAKSREHHEKALELAESIGQGIRDLDTCAKALLGLGTHFWHLGEFQKALDACHKALEYIEQSKDQWNSLPKILTTLSVIYADAGQIETAVDYAIRAVDVCIQRDQGDTLGVALNNLATLYAQEGNTDEAIETLNQAVLVAQNTGNLRQEALALNNMATCMLICSEDETQLEDIANVLGWALDITNDISSPSLEALVTGTLGRVYQARGETEKATGAFLKAARIYRNLGMRTSESEILTDLAMHLRDHVGDIEGAIQACRKAIEIREGIRGHLKSEAHRISYAEASADPYELIVGWLIERGSAEEALEYMERAKSRALVDLLAMKLVDQVSVGLDSDAFQKALDLLVEVEALRRNIEKMAREQEFLEEPADSNRSRGENELFFDPMLEELEEKERLLESAYSRIRSIDPDSASLLRVQVINLDNIKKILDKDSVLLELFQGQDRLYLVLTGSEGIVGLHSIKLSEQDAWEQVRSILFAIRHTAYLDIRDHEFLREVHLPLIELFDLLIAPLQSRISHHKRLFISPHLFWHYFPFHALYDKGNAAYLCDQIEMGYCPSASVLGLCLSKNRLGRENAVIFARDNGDLPHVYEEVELLEKVFDSPPRIYKADQSVISHLSTQDSPVDMIHIACHGRFDPDQPFLSGIDIPPEEAQDRWTYLLDLFALHLDCNLVTLSACESALSQLTRADELIGLARGLFSAGAASLILSLWQVADKSTSYFMENFYWHYVKNHNTKTRALQLAMQAVRAKKEYAHPYFWAPFVVMGDWR